MRPPVRLLIYPSFRSPLTTLMNEALVALATALAIMVFPVPGGPYMRTPLGGSMPICLYSSKCVSGSSTASFTYPGGDGTTKQGGGKRGYLSANRRYIDWKKSNRRRCHRGMTACTIETERQSQSRFAGQNLAVSGSIGHYT